MRVRESDNDLSRSQRGNRTHGRLGFWLGTGGPAGNGWSSSLVRQGSRKQMLAVQEPKAMSSEWLVSGCMRGVYELAGRRGGNSGRLWWPPKLVSSGRRAD